MLRLYHQKIKLFIFVNYGINAYIALLLLTPYSLLLTLHRLLAPITAYWLPVTGQSHFFFLKNLSMILAIRT